MRLEINLEHYQVFYYVAKLGSISKTAEALHLTQPAVSHIIKLLEYRLGCQLFYRRSRGVELTGNGAILLPYVSSMLNQITAGEKRITKLVNLEEGELYIGAIETVLADFLPGYIRRFSEQYPGIRIHIKGPSSMTIIEGVLNGTLDVGFVVSPVETLSSRLSFTSLYETRDIFVAGARYEEYRQRIMPLATLLQEPLICLQKHTSGRAALEAYAASTGIELKPTYSVFSPNTIIELTSRNLGIGIIMEDCVKDELQSGKLFELHAEALLPERQIYMVTSKEFPLSMACRSFISLIESSASPERSRRRISSS